jgi:hypothetical protein
VDGFKRRKFSYLQWIVHMLFHFTIFSWNKSSLPNSCHIALKYELNWVLWLEASLVPVNWRWNHIQVYDLHSDCLRFIFKFDRLCNFQGSTIHCHLILFSQLKLIILSNWIQGSQSMNSNTMQQIHQGYQHKSFKEENSKTKLGEFQRQTRKI